MLWSSEFIAKYSTDVANSALLKKIKLKTNYEWFSIETFMNAQLKSEYDPFSSFFARFFWRWSKIVSFELISCIQNWQQNTVFVLVLGKLYWIPRKKWTFSALLGYHWVHKISWIQGLSTKLMETIAVCPRN